MTRDDWDDQRLLGMNEMTRDDWGGLGMRKDDRND